MERVYDLPWDFGSPVLRAHARDSIRAILGHAPNEAAAVLEALNAGRIDGRNYSGRCACLLGTIANARGCHYREVHGYLNYLGGSPAEHWFLGIRPGDTPEDSEPARLAAEWIQEWVDEHAPAPVWVDAVDELAQAPDMVAV